MKHKGLLIALVIVLLAGGAFLFGMAVSLVAGGGSGSLSWPGGGKVGVVTVDGAIISADTLVDELEGFRKEDGIKSVVLRIESPGGSVAASQEILEAVRKLAAKKPVVASMGSVAASGGYYVSCGATRVLANPGTITGSIGVRMEHVMLGDLLSWAKIRHETLKSGRMKDLGSFDRPMTPEERAILEEMLRDIHEQFKDEVAKSRNLSQEKVDELADGRVYTGRQALELGLVDKMGGLDEAVELAANLGGIKGEPKIVRPKKMSPLIERLVGAASDLAGKASAAAAVETRRPMLMMGYD